MKVVITGGSGFIGSHLADFLIDSDYEVVVVDNLSIGRVENISHLLERPSFTFIEADITNFDEIEPIFKDTDWVFHLAALADIVPSIENPTEYYKSNVNGTFNVLQACRKHQVKKIVYASIIFFILAIFFGQPMGRFFIEPFLIEEEICSFKCFSVKSQAPLWTCLIHVYFQIPKV